MAKRIDGILEFDICTITNGIKFVKRLYYL